MREREGEKERETEIKRRTEEKKKRRQKGPKERDQIHNTLYNNLYYRMKNLEREREINNHDRRA